MTVLTIHTKTLTAIETVNGDNVRYVESFASWANLLRVLGPYLNGNSYAWVEVKA